MKFKKLSLFLLTITALNLLLAATSLCVSAERITYPVEGGNIYYDPGYHNIVGCDKTVTNVVIPSEINGERVARIAAYVFRDCVDLKSVTLPDSLIHISSFAFDGCSSLETINIPDGVPTLGRYVFNNCTSLRSVTLPANLTHIHESAFEGCDSLKAIDIPDSVIYIGVKAFRDCDSLESIKLPNNSTEICDSAFARNKSLTSITIPSSVVMGSYAFGNNPALKEINFCEGLTTVKGFSSNHALETVVLPDSIKTIGGFSFSSCDSLKTIIIPEGLKTIENSAFKECSALEYVHYSGDEASWNKISINTTGNECFINAARHSFVWRTVTAPTCVDTGTQVAECPICGIIATRDIPVIEHKWSDCVTIFPPTCKEEGTGVSICSECDASKSVTLPITDHILSEWIITLEPGCATSGSRYYLCSYCSTKVTEKIPPTGEHNWGDWREIVPSCTIDGSKVRSCLICSATETCAIPATGEHVWSKWVVTTASTCAKEGQEKRICANCKAAETRTIPVFDNHSWSDWVMAVAPTVNSEGKEVRLCTVCNTTESRAIPATCDHTFGEWSVTVEPTCEMPGEEQRFCTECGNTEFREIEPIDHTEVHVEAKDPSCVEDGNIEYYYCSVCGYHRTPDGLPTNRFNVIVPSTGDHSFGEWTITIQPTVFDTGEQSRSCSICGETEVEELAKLEMTNPFTDVKEGKWYTEGILYCYHNNYMTGMTSDLFGYKESVTRAMFVTILAKIDGADTSSYTETSFSDVKAGQWYSASIEWAYQNGYAAGIGDKIFGYKENVSREQIAMFLYTYSEKNDISVTRRAALAGFDDYDRIHAYALDAVSWAVKVGLISGTSDTILAPRDPATRAEIALIINNYVENVMNTEIIEAGTDSEFTRDGTPKKYFTLSFDDGITQDARIIEILKKYDVDCCTFNINTGLYGVSWPAVGVSLGRPDITHIRYTEEELMTGIYDGYDVEVHTLHHPALGDYDSNPEYIINQVAGDAANIQKITGRTPIGMAWPGGDDFYTGTTIDIILKNTDIRFARGTTSTFGFKLPQYFMKWLPTCSVSDPLVLEYAKTFLRTPCTEDMLFYVWGHGYEFDFYHSYDTFEALIKMISEADDIVLVTNAEFYQLFKDEIPSWH